MLKCQTISCQEGVVSQGDVFRDVEHVEHVRNVGDQIEVSRVHFPFVLVLTQECDLQQARAQLISVLVAPMYNAEHVYAGDHLSELGITMPMINRKKTPGTILQNNQNPRYHFLSFEKKVGMFDLVIDFRQYFSVSLSHLNGDIGEGRRLFRLADLFREDVNQRFASYLSRIGLPVTE